MPMPPIQVQRAEEVARLGSEAITLWSLLAWSGGEVRSLAPATLGRLPASGSRRATG